MTFPSGDNSQGQQGTSDAPYQEYLNQIPEENRAAVEEVFKKWDGDVTRRFQQVHSQYEPYKDVITQWQPDEVATAVNVLQALDRDPKAVVKQLADAGMVDLAELVKAAGEQGDNGTQQQGNQNQQQEPDPRYQSLEQQVQQIAQILVAQNQQSEQQQQLNLLNSTLSGLHSQHDVKNAKGEVVPGFDDTFVTAMMANGATPEQAIKMFQDTVGQYAQLQNQPGQQAPFVLGAGGGTPSTNVDVSKMSSAERIDHVVKQLQLAHQQDG